MFKSNVVPDLSRQAVRLCKFTLSLCMAKLSRHDSTCLLCTWGDNLVCTRDFSISAAKEFIYRVRRLLCLRSYCLNAVSVCLHYSCWITFGSLPAIKLVQGLHQYRRDRLWSGTTLRLTAVPLPCPFDLTHSWRPMGWPRCGGGWLAQPWRCLMQRKELSGQRNNSCLANCIVCFCCRSLVLGWGWMQCPRLPSSSWLRKRKWRQKWKKF